MSPGYRAPAGTSTAVVRRGLLLADGPETTEILRAHGSPIHFSSCVHDTLGNRLLISGRGQPAWTWPAPSLTIPYRTRALIEAEGRVSMDLSTIVESTIRAHSETGSNRMGVRDAHD